MTRGNEPLDEDELGEYLARFGLSVDPRVTLD